jgi:hypothetical protein
MRRRKPDHELIVHFTIVFTVFVIIVALMTILSTAYAHDEHQFVADKMLRDPVSGAFCCGPVDCHVLGDNDVKEVSGGFAVHMKTDVIDFDETIPYNRAMPFSPDGRYHACVGWTYPNIPKIRCFIIPLPNS